MLKRRLAQARIDRILKRFQRDDVPDLVQYVSGVSEPQTGSIDDGAAYEPQTRQRPDWVAKDMIGWE